MKKNIFSLLFFFFAMNISAQVPDKISYQAIVRNNNNQLLSNTKIGMSISILQGAADGAVVYAETQTPTSNSNGLISIEIGGGTVSSGSISTIDWSLGKYFIKTEIDPNGGNTYLITSVSQLVSVPFALYAKSAGNGFSGDYDDITNKPINIDTDSTNDVTIKGNQSIVGKKTFEDTLFIKKGINANDTKISNLANPLFSKDAVNKEYVDNIAKQLEEYELLNNKLKDVEGNLYSVLKINDVIWMGENLKTTKYNDGSPIPLITSDAVWITSTEGYCNEQNIESNYKKYGRLYNFSAIFEAKGVCPLGWRLPTEEEWSSLFTYLGGDNVAAYKMKQEGTSLWLNPNDASNESGMNILPSGIRMTDGSFAPVGQMAAYWFMNSGIGVVVFQNNSKAVTKTYDTDGRLGGAVRCVKD